MSEPNLQPLAALLASHPEECAAVVAMLALVDSRSPMRASKIGYHVKLYAGIDGEHIEEILDAGVAAGFVHGGKHEGPFVEYQVNAWADRYAIARMGAAAWLRARCSGEGAAK